MFCSEESGVSVIKNRNFDPTSRTLRKHAKEDVDMEDTVEKDVAGMAEKIIAEDEERRAQELVRGISMQQWTMSVLTGDTLGCVQHSSQAAKLGSEARIRQEACQAGAENAGSDTHSDPYVILYFVQ